jgi:hypothetical protein
MTLSASDDLMISRYWIGKDVEGSGRGLMLSGVAAVA